MAIKINVYNQEGKAVSEMEVSDQVFGVKVNEALVHQAAVAQMGNERQNVAHTKDRSEVRGGGRKPWVQKGTGRARAGSIRSPIWIGGGVTFGPRNERNYTKQLNKKMKRKALCTVLSDKVQSERLVVVDDLEASEFKTKTAKSLLNQMEKAVLGTEDKTKRSVLVINDKYDEKVKYSFRNLKGVKVVNLDSINILDLLKYRDVVITRKSMEKLNDKYSQ